MVFGEDCQGGSLAGCIANVGGRLLEIMLEVAGLRRLLVPMGRYFENNSTKGRREVSYRSVWLGFQGQEPRGVPWGGVVLERP
jgi:hypothetical protein